MFRILLSAVCAFLLSFIAGSLPGAEFELSEDADGVTVQLDGELFTRYLVKSGPKPILWPVVGPSGLEMTRGYPMRKAGRTERDDHRHHRSFWFTHGDVNGIDFWSESGKNGRIVHRAFDAVKSGSQGRLVSINDWMSPRGDKVCEDRRTLTFGAAEGLRWVDFDVVVTATEGPVKFGDTKEGSFGVRVAGSMKVTSDPGGRIVNSEGQTDTQAWGKRAEWVDYSGQIGDKIVGVAILNHPTSFRYPTYWHVRTYGLFTANPFGLHHFQGTDKVDGSHTVPKGERLVLRHRVVFHDGDADQADVEGLFQNYAQSKKD